MEYEDEQLSQIESSPWRANKAEKAYLHTQLKIAENELRRLDAGLAVLLANRSRVMRRIQLCRTSLAPYSKLPTELIRKIILLCVSGTCNLPLKLGKKDPRLQITQICSSWRCVAFGIADLWNVHLAIIPGKSTVSLLAAWFRQSSGTCITLTMSNNGKNSPSPGPAGPLLKEVVIPYTHRFTTLHCSRLLAPGEWCSLPFDVLTSISLHFRPFMTKPHEILNAPLIRHLEITEVSAPLDFDFTLLQCLPRIPWAQLTSISLTKSPQFRDIYEVLSLCTSLQRCNLDGIWDDSTSLNRRIPVDPKMIDLPHLEELRMKFGSPEYFHRLLLLNAPNLTSLAVTIPPDEPELLQMFAEFVEAKSKTLRSFEILGRYIDTGALVYEIIRTLPFITHFLAKKTHIPLPILSQIGARALLPNIEALELDSRGDYTDDHILDALVPETTNRTSRLMDICIHTFLLPSYHTTQRMQQLRSQGVNVLLDDD